MRQRKIPNLESKLNSLQYMMVDVKSPPLPGFWKKDLFGDGKGDLYIEVGCGKGTFITTMASRQPNDYFVAIEGQASVALRAMEKANALGIENLRFYVGYVDDPDALFASGELSGVYLNFSDPWPKKRHEKRRLTYYKRLEGFGKIVDKKGFIQFKTDNDQLFDFTIEEIPKAKLEVIEISRDLHRSPYMKDNVMTEYELKFSSKGKNINFVRMGKFGGRHENL